MPSRLVSFLAALIAIAASRCSPPPAAALLLLPGGARVPRRRPVAVAFAASSVSAPETTAPAPSSLPSIAPGRRGADFFEGQLDVCRRVVADNDDDDDDGLKESERRNGGGGARRSRFDEHPRCTARFGEVLLHARDGAASIEEHRSAVRNARSIVNYVDSRQRWGWDGGSCRPIREGLAGDVAAALGSRSLWKFRARQIEDVPTVSTNVTRADFTPEQADLEILGRLYYSAIRASGRYLEEVGLTCDHGGFTALLALCRAASSPLVLPKSVPSKDEAALDAALSDHFNGITAPGRRFLFSPRHGTRTDGDPGGTRRPARAGLLVVAFSSLGNGLVRHEFGGSLAKMNQRLDANGGDVFDVLFVADPSQSWYQKDSRGGPDGFAEYERRIRASSRPYGQISLVGDSMGGSAALLFSHLAGGGGGSVVAFSPQVNLQGDGHVGRYDMTTEVREVFRSQLLRSVDEAATEGVRVAVHRGVELADVAHTDHLVGQLSGGALGGRGQVRIVEHPDCRHHQVAVHLKKRGLLETVLSNDLIPEESSVMRTADDHLDGNSK